MWPRLPLLAVAQRARSRGRAGQDGGQGSGAKTFPFVLGVSSQKGKEVRGEIARATGTARQTKAGFPLFLRCPRLTPRNSLPPSTESQSCCSARNLLTILLAPSIEPPEPSGFTFP